ncbi:MAG: hypothetical protein V4456_12560 [Bacteroidota bacterium]
MIFNIHSQKGFWDSFALTCTLFNVDMPPVSFSEDLPLKAKIDDAFFKDLKEKHPNQYDSFFERLNYIK